MSTISIIKQAPHDEPLNSDEINHFSQVLKACADPLRVQILKVLNNDTFGVLELRYLKQNSQA